MPHGTSKKLQYSRFTQQELPSWKPILTPGWVITTLVLVGIVFVPVGLATLKAAENVVEIIDRYDEDCVPEYQDSRNQSFIKIPDSNKTCIRSLTVPKKMTGPIYIYYELQNFHQNHRRYVKSRCDRQLHSKAGEAGCDDCEPELEVNGKPIVPCGLIAWSLFNDTYNFSLYNQNLTVHKTGIAWASDLRKFGSHVYPQNFQAGELIGGGKLDESIPLNQQEDLLVWMRTAALPDFRKLYGRMTTDLEANVKINVVIQNNYNVYEFGGQKKLVLSTSSRIGGKNDFLGVAYLTVGGLCLIMAAIFIILYIIKPRPYGDPAYLSWNRNPNGL